MSIKKELEVIYMSVGEVNPAKYNPRNITDEELSGLRESLKKFGFVEPLVYNKRTDTLCGGHQRLKAAILEGYEKVPVSMVDLSIAEEKALNVALNSPTISGKFDNDILRVLLDEIKIELPDYFEALNFGEFELLEIEIKKLATAGEDIGPGEPPLQPKTRRGDVWILGNHRLMCGNSTEIDAMDKLMNKGKADMVFTSPPYNVGKTPNGNDNKYNTYVDDKDQSEYLELLRSFTLNALMYCDYVFCNIQSLAGNKVALIEYLYELKDNYADTIIWDKETAEPAMARKVLNSQFEYVHIFSNEAKRTVGKKDFRGTLSNIFSLNSRSGKEFAKVHKATFRVELPEYFLENFCETSVIEPFAGTGTTLIAAEKKGMKCFAMELDESYCDIIIKRWEAMTEKQAILESTGEAYEYVSRY